MEHEKTADATVKAALRLSQVGRHDRALQLLEDAMIERPEEDDILGTWRRIRRRVKKQLWRQRLWLLAPVVLTSLLIAVLVLSHHSTEVLLHLEAEGVGFDLAEPDLHVDNFFRTLGVTGAPLQTATVVHLDEIEISAGEIEGAGRHLRLKLPSPQVPVELTGVRATRLEVGPRKPAAPSRIDLVTEPTPEGAALTLLVRSSRISGQLEIVEAGSLETGQPATAANGAPGRTFRQLRFVPGSQGMDWVELTRAGGQVQMQLEIPEAAAGAGEELSVSSISFVQRQSDPLNPQSMVQGGEIRFPDYQRDPIPLERGTFVLFDPGDRVRVELSLDKGRLKADLRGRMQRLRVGMSAGDAVNVVPSTLLWIVEREKQTVVLYAIGVVLSVVYGFLQRMKLIHAD
jgi:translation initiation factor IF-1